MYWNYDYVSQKFPPMVKDAWTIKEIVESTAVFGDKVYLIDAPTGNQFSYEQSNRIANRIAHSLIQLGMQKGDRLAVLMTNKPEYVFSLFAVGKAGLIEVPMNVNLGEREILHIVEQAEVSTILVEAKPEFLRIIATISMQTPILKTVIVQGAMTDIPQMRASVVSFDEWMNHADETNPTIDVEPTDKYALFFTSGTTGLPKGAPLTNKTSVLAAKSICAIPGITQDARNYTCLPLFHVNAQLYSAMMLRCLGATLILSNRFRPRTFWQEINRYQATYFNSIGGMMQILDSAFEVENVPEHSARFVLVGGTPKALWERFEQKFHVDVLEAYSMSENPIPFANLHPDKTLRKIGSFGKPIFPDLGREVRLVNDRNEEIPKGIGELVQKGEDCIITEYWNAPEATREAIDFDGWFHSGDMIEKDDEGYFFYVDRKKFMIRVAGENVSAFEIEDVVNHHPAVEQSAAIPVPDSIRDEEIKVFIKLKPGETPIDFAEIISFCADRLAYFKVPRYVEIIQQFPKTATERIQKAELKLQEKERTYHGWDRNEHIPDWRKRYYGNR
ncbi:UNVERIFIED_CONTAM: crotonobetaine/carnitine-CoA ligase [Brevibacillus sp. OAP136]